MGAVRGVLTGVLGLVAFQTVIAAADKKGSPDRFGGLLTGVASIAQRGLDPGVALIPDLRKKSAGTAAPPSAGGKASPAPVAPSPPASGFVAPRLPSVAPVPAPQIAPYPAPSPS